VEGEKSSALGWRGKKLGKIPLGWGWEQNMKGLESEEEAGLEEQFESGKKKQDQLECKKKWELELEKK